MPLNDKDPEYWFSLAAHDIDTVDILIEQKGHAEIIVYHMHQAIEKILKGNILRNKCEFPFIHDLERLYKLLISKNNQFDGKVDLIIILQSYYQETRYPQSDFLDINELGKADKAFLLLLDFLKDKQET